MRDNFITDLIDADVDTGALAGVGVVTRFPPEPNGYLHIGHAKSICLNFGIAQRYGGACYLRFDDTNPLKEEALYVEAIERDVRWLGFNPAENAPRFASDYFERIYGFAEELVAKGLAYVCSQSADDMRAGRGTPYAPGVDSPDRDRAPEDSLDLLRRMRAGEFPDGAYTLRARIDMAHPNMVMRDPALYRIRHATHHRQGDAWCIYPMYDFAHCLEDAVEGVTHSICTLEFESNRALYDWVLDHVTPPARPKQIEFARLNLDYTVMSKRKLLRLVDEGLVAGWDDPRMPTLAGLRRRGVPPEAIRALCDMVGVSKANSVVDMGKLEYCLRDELNGRSPRLLGVLQPLRATIEGLPGDELVHDAPLWPREIDRSGSRALVLTPEILVEADDFAAQPKKGWKRLAPGRTVRLRHGPLVRCEGMEGEGDDKVLRLAYVSDEEGASVRGVIHWVSATRSVPVEVRLYDRLIKTPSPGDDFLSDLNPGSLVVRPHARIEPGPLPERFQLERLGFFCLDPDSTPDRPVLNRIVTLKDSWAKAKAGFAQRKARPNKPQGSRQAPAKRLDDAARHYVSEHGVSEEQALVLAADPQLGALFEETVEAGAAAEISAAWVAGPVRRHVKDAKGVAQLRYDAKDLAELLRRLADADLTRAQAREGLESLASTGTLPEFGGGGDLETTLDALLVAQADPLARYRAGQRQLLGFFMGEAMRATRGAFDPAEVRAALRRKLEG